MSEIRVLIAAAGRGSRSGLSYPKTLYPVLGKPILVRLIELLRAIDPRPTVVISPEGRPAVAACLATHRLEVDLVEQDQPTGMGDAILCFRNAPAYAGAKHLLLVWGDLPLLQWDTVRQLCERHLTHANDFTLVSRHVQKAYTIISRRADGSVDSVEETRETEREARPGERDIGVFVFRTELVLPLLEQRLPGAIGQVTGEHGFLYIIRRLVERGCRVEALPIASEFDLISLNKISDLGDLSHSGGSPLPRN